MGIGDWPHVYGHIDADAFYVSVELERDPGLRGKPVVVAGSGPRAVVTTASYEARRFGIFSATPAERARRLCPQAVFLPPDFEAYRARSGELMAVLRGQVERVEVVGLDEAYLDLSGLERPRAAARRLKETVLAETGLRCSIGLGPSKLVAKVASDASKPDGFLELDADRARRRFADVSPALIPGIGPKTVDRLERHRITTLAALAATPEQKLSEWFGARLGPHLRRLARFEDSSPIETVRVPKSESRETTFDRDKRGVDALLPVLDRLCEDLCATLRRQGRAGPTIGIKVRFDDFTTRTRARTIAAATNDLAVVRAVGGELLAALGPTRPVRLLGVRVAGLDGRRRASQPAIPDDQLELSIGAG
jgi:DNA polymerase IV